MRLVLDASTIVAYRVGPIDGPITGATLREHDLHAPAICDVEVVGAIATSTPERSGAATGSGTPCSAADAAYVALAESLDASLVTVDRSLSRAVRRHTSVELFG